MRSGSEHSTAGWQKASRERLNALVSSGFALGGLLLASVRLYGLCAFLVTERTKEIGIRISLLHSWADASVGLRASFRPECPLPPRRRCVQPPWPCARTTSPSSL
jgi:hypothetical protein